MVRLTRQPTGWTFHALGMKTRRKPVQVLRIQRDIYELTDLGYTRDILPDFHECFCAENIFQFDGNGYCTPKGSNFVLILG
jgi:hypothetical protein